MEAKDALQEALRVLDTFASVDVTHFDLTYLDIDRREKRISQDSVRSHTSPK
jgi:hypothetical protein